MQVDAGLDAWMQVGCMDAGFFDAGFDLHPPASIHKRMY